MEIRLGIVDRDSSEAVKLLNSRLITLGHERCSSLHGSSTREGRDKVPRTVDNLTHAEHKLVALINATPTVCASDDHIVVEELKAQLELTLADFVQLGRTAKLTHENAGDFEYGKELNRRCRPLINNQVDAALLLIQKRLTHLGDIKNRHSKLFRCRRALSNIVDQAAFSSRNSVDIDELDTLIGKAKSLGQEMTDNLKATNEYAFSKVHGSESRNDLALVNETVPYVCRPMSTRIAYLQHQQKTTYAKKGYR